MDPYRFEHSPNQDETTGDYIGHRNTANHKENFCHGIALMQTEHPTHTFTEADWYAIELTTPDMPDVPLHPRHGYLKKNEYS